MVSKALRSQFEARLSLVYPGFERMAVTLPGGSKKYAWAVTEHFAAYLMLQIDEKRDRFNLSIGFGEPGRAPRPTVPSSYEQAVATPGFFRLGWIVRRPYRDIWWNIDPLASSGHKLLMAGKLVGRQLPPEDECIAAIPGLLDSAFAELAEHAVPFFKDAAGRLGIDLNLDGHFGVPVASGTGRES
jgi:hypothetical protein